MGACMHAPTHACAHACMRGRMHACVRGVTYRRKRSCRASGATLGTRSTTPTGISAPSSAAASSSTRACSPRQSPTPQALQRWLQSRCGCGTRMGSPRPRLHRDCTHRCDLCVGGRASRSTQGAIQGYSKGTQRIPQGCAGRTVLPLWQRRVRREGVEGGRQEDARPRHLLHRHDGR